MRLYLVLLPLLLLGQSNLWSWQIKEKMTREEIKVALLRTQQELDALLTTNNIAVSSLDDNQQMVLKEAYGVLGLTFIGKKTFIEYATNWIDAFISISSMPQKKDVVLNVETVMTSLGNKILRPKLPLSILLWKELETELGNLEREATPEAIRMALYNGFVSFKKDIEVKFMLSKHYKKNKDYYKKIDASYFDKNIMDADDFNGWMTELSSKRSEETKAAVQEEQAFNLAYGEWFQEQKVMLSNIVSQDRGTDSTNTMSKAKFVVVLLKENKVWQAIQPELGNDLSQQILSNLEEDSLEIKDYVNAMNKALNELSTPISVIANNWYKSRRLPDLAGLKTALTTENDGNGDYDIIEEYIQWFAQVGGVVDSLKLSSNRQFVATKLVQSFSRVLGSPELQAFLPALEGEVSTYNKKFLSVKETAQLWKTAIGQIIRNPNSLVDNYNRLKKAGSRPDSLDQVLLGQAGVDTLQALFKGALRPLPKLAALANGEAIDLELTLNDGTVLTSRIKTKIDREKQTPFALASGLELLVTKGSSAYNFKETALLSQSPVFNSKEQVTVDFEYSVQFSKDRGSSEQGGGVAIDSGVTNSREDSATNSTEVTHTEGTVVGKNASSTTGITGKTDFSLFGLFEAGAEVSEHITIGGHKDWTEETSVETGKSNTTTLGTSTSTNVSSNANWNATIKHGQDSGYFTIKGSLVSSAIDTNGGTMLLSVEVLEIKSPDMKGFAITQSIPEQNKTVRWKK